MALEINYDAIRIKLEFTYRVLTQLAVGFQIRKPNYSDEIMMDLIAMVGTRCAAEIHTHRYPDMMQVSNSEVMYTKVIAKLIIDELNKLQFKIHAELCGLPITLTIAMEEGLVREGCDKIVDLLKAQYAAHEHLYN
jgi:hypothetical protein